MRTLLRLACRAFPRDHRARRSDEVVDTALLAADGSAWRAAGEALSLAVAGAWQRLRAESRRSPREGVVLLAGVLAVVNLAVALAGISLGIDSPQHPPIWGARVDPRTLRWFNPFVLDWWWIGFAVAAAAIVLGLAFGSRRLALGAGLANLGLVGYDAIFLPATGRSFSLGHLTVFSYAEGWTPGQTSGFPAGRQWLVAVVVLALAIALAPLRRSSLKRLPLMLLAAVLIVVIARETWSGFFVFLRWPLAVIVVLAIAFGVLGPRLAVVAVGVTLAAVPVAAGYLATPYIRHAPVVPWAVSAALILGVGPPLAQLTRRRLT